MNRGSLNTLLAHAAAESVRRAGSEPTVVHLRDLSMPIHDGDLEAEPRPCSASPPAL